MIEPTYNGKKINVLSDDDLFEYLTKLRLMRSNNACGKYESLGSSMDSILLMVEEEYQDRLLKTMINNDPINLGSIDDTDDFEL